MKSLIDFERYYISFGQLIPEWRTITAPAQKQGFNFHKAKRDIIDFLQKIKLHPYYLIEPDATVHGVDLQQKKLGVEMLDHIRQVMIELQHYLKVKQDMIKDYLNLWKSRDNKDNYFNDFLMLNRLKENLNQLENEIPSINQVQKPTDPSMKKQNLKESSGSVDGGLNSQYALQRERLKEKDQQENLQYMVYDPNFKAKQQAKNEKYSRLLEK